MAEITNNTGNTNKTSRISDICTKIDEIKLATEAPDVSTLLSEFTWTREWFKSAEDALLDLAYRGESDAAVVEFIRAKIREIDVRSFNKVMRSFGHKPIKNHYDMLIEHENKELLHYAYNENESIIDYTIEIARNREYSYNWSKNTNSKMVKYLIEDPKMIQWMLFSANPNELAVDYALKNIQNVVLKSFATNTNIRAVQYMIDNPDKINDDFSVNSSDAAVDYLLANPDKIHPGLFCLNTNDRAVQYLISNPNLINWYDFNRNENNIAVDYILAHPEKIEKRAIGGNMNAKVTKYLIDNPHLIYDHSFIKRTDDLAIDYILSGNIDLSDDENMQDLSLNNSDRITEYLMDNTDLIWFAGIANNNCNYNMQKFRAFNALGLFPRINGLVI